MKKQLLFVAAFVATMFGTVSAQNSVVFDDWEQGEKNITSVVTKGIFTFTASEKNAMSVDANSSKFEDGVTYTTRLKTAGTSKDDDRTVKIACPSAGTVIIAARTGSNSATDRNIVGTFNGTEVLNKILLESEAEKKTYTDDNGETKTRSIYPYVKVNISGAGDLVLSAPTGSINYYYLAFDNGDTPNNIASSVAEKVIIGTEYYNVAGVKMAEAQKGLNIVKNIYEDGSVQVTKTYIK